MELTELRERIDRIDADLVRLFTERMALSGQVAEYKKEHNLPALDASRERQKLAAVRAAAGEQFAQPASVLYGTIFDLSRAYQDGLLLGPSELAGKIEKALETTPKLFPQSALVACQGVEGAYSQIAAEKLFAMPDIMYCNHFKAVFSAIESGLCQYGVLPLENSTAGSVTSIYDLMMEHNFSIVRSVRLKVDHNLLAKKGTKLADIKEIYSHDQGNNFTRFICIAKNLEIYPGADRTSIMLTVPHKPGSLYRVLARINALGLNLNKLESRPIPERDFEFMFYFDLDTSVYSPQFIQLMNELDTLCEHFEYLGSYTEIV